MRVWAVKRRWKKTVVDVKSKLSHGCFQDRWNNQEVYESSSLYIYACNRILVTLSFIASSKCSQSNNKFTPNREIPSTSYFFFSFFTCRVEGCCIKAANGKLPWFWASKTSGTEPLEINAKNRNSCSPGFQNFIQKSIFQMFTVPLSTFICLRIKTNKFSQYLTELT